MGRERQKRKNRSGLPKVRQRTKSKKQIFHNPIIAANWDKNQTLSQNYKRLGLAVKLNKQSGGVEKDLVKLAQKHDGDEDFVDKPDSLTIAPTQGQSAFGLEEIRVEKDPSTGRIVRVVQSDSTTAKPNPLNDPLNDLDFDSDAEERRWARLDNQHGNTSTKTDAVARTKPMSDVVAQLESRANMPAAKHTRRQTDNERDFVQALVRKHGDDYERMARDMKLNYMQRSAGDLKRRIKKWRVNGGTLS